MKAVGRVREETKIPYGTYFGSTMVFHHLYRLVRYLNVVDYDPITTDDV